MDSLKECSPASTELQAAFSKAAPQEMRRYQTGFDYLPMLLKNDPAWQLPDPWDRPRPRRAVGAIARYLPRPRLRSPRSHRARHVQLMQAVTARHSRGNRLESAPVGVEHNAGLWQKSTCGWNASGAHDTFVGFLNHASPQYCWREEQPRRMRWCAPYRRHAHNWASAECIRYAANAGA